MINLWQGWWPGKMKKIMCDPITACTFSPAASWLQSLINLQLFFFVIVVLLLIWWWRGWRWWLLDIVTASRSWYHDWHQNGQASTPLWPGERRSTFLQAIGFLLCFSFLNEIPHFFSSNFQSSSHHWSSESNHSSFNDNMQSLFKFWREMFFNNDIVHV